MSERITMPQLGETVTEGTILRWLVKVGDEIKEDDPILEISTDKVDTEVPSPFSGTVSSLLVEEGETVEVGSPLLELDGTSTENLNAEATESVEQEDKIEKIKEPAQEIFENKEIVTESKTIQNLKIVKTDVENNLLFVKGAVPGPTGSILKITKSVKYS